MRHASGLQTLRYVKWALILLMIIVLLVSGLRGRSSRTPFAEMAEQVRSAADLSAMAEADNQMLRRLYGLDPTELENVMLYYPASSMGAEELLLVQMKDRTQQEMIQTAIETRRDTQISNFDGYGADQTAMLQNSVVEVRGNYALFVSAADPAAVQEAFRKAY